MCVLEISHIGKNNENPDLECENGMPHSYRLDQSISVLRVVW